MENQNRSSNQNVVNLAQYRKRQAKQKPKSRATSSEKAPQNSIVLNHTQGKASAAQNEYSDRLGRIKASLERINNLMADLRKVSQDMKTENAPAVDRRR